MIPKLKSFVALGSALFTVLIIILSVPTEKALADELRRLPPPTNLRWIMEEGNPLSVSWNVPPDVPSAELTLYRDGEIVKGLFLGDGSTSIQCSRHEGEDFMSKELSGKGISFETGVYTFSVVLAGDRVEYADSEPVFSEPFNYVKPKESLKAPSNLHWDPLRPLKIVWDYDPEAIDYQIQYFKDGFALYGYKSPAWLCEADPIGERYPDDIEDVRDYFCGSFQYAVKKISHDLKNVADSDWAFSPEIWYDISADTLPKQPAPIDLKCIRKQGRTYLTWSGVPEQASSTVKFYKQNECLQEHVYEIVYNGSHVEWPVPDGILDETSIYQFTVEVNGIKGKSYSSELAWGGSFYFAKQNNETAPPPPDKIINLTIGSKTYYVNGEPLIMDTAPFIESGSTYVPVRFIAEALGSEVKWDEEAKTASIFLDGRTLVLFVDENLMSGTAFFKDNRLFVPLRYVSEYVGATVNWHEETKTVEVMK